MLALQPSFTLNIAKQYCSVLHITKSCAFNKKLEIVGLVVLIGRKAHMYEGHDSNVTVDIK